MGSEVKDFIILELLHTFFSNWLSNSTVSSGLSISGQKLFIEDPKLFEDEL